MTRTDDDRDAELDELRRSAAALRAACAETRRRSRELQASLGVEMAESRELRVLVRASVADRLKDGQAG